MVSTPGRNLRRHRPGADALHAHVDVSTCCCADKMSCHRLGELAGILQHQDQIEPPSDEAVAAVNVVSISRGHNVSEQCCWVKSQCCRVMLVGTIL